MFAEFKSGLARAALSFILLAVVTPVAMAGPSKTVRDWTVYCSDDLICSLTALFRSDSLYSIEFRRRPKANAPVTLRATFAEQPIAGSDVLLKVPGVLADVTLQASQAELTEGTTEFADDRILQELMPALRDGDRLVVSFETISGKKEADISLSGSSAAMLFMDEVQDRVDKTDALVAKGSLTATGRQSRARELKAADAIPPEVRQLWEADPDLCSGEPGEDLISRFGGTVITFRGEVDAEVFILPCGWPGAYNISHRGYLYDPGARTARALMFPTMSEKGPTVTTSITNGSWDEMAGQLTSYYKGRGLGDCGVFSKWEWTGDGLYGNFVLVEERAKSDCDGKDDDWPLIWPKQ